MTSHSDDVISQMSRLRQVLDDKYAHAHASIRSVAQLAAQMGDTAEPKTPVRLALSEQTGSDVTRVVMASLMEVMDVLRRSTGDARATWRSTKATVSDIWRAMINDDDMLRNFYLNVYNDVSDVMSRAGALMRDMEREKIAVDVRHDCMHALHCGNMTNRLND